MSKKIANLFVLDRSSSMGVLRDKVIEGYNEQIESVKKLDEANGTKSTFSLVFFDSHVETKFLKQDILTAEGLTTKTYIPSGMTAFYDGLAKAIKALEDALGSELADTEVLVTTMTDGQENSSREYLGSQLADLIHHFQKEYGWTFSFIGANIDTEKLATDLKVSASNAINFAYSAGGATAAFNTLRSARSSYYTKKLSGEDTTEKFFASDTQK